MKSSDSNIVVVTDEKHQNNFARFGVQILPRWSEPKMNLGVFLHIGWAWA